MHPLCITPCERITHFLHNFPQPCTLFPRTVILAPFSSSFFSLVISNFITTEMCSASVSNRSNPWTRSKNRPEKSQWNRVCAQSCAKCTECCPSGTCPARGPTACCRREENPALGCASIRNWPASRTFPFYVTSGRKDRRRCCSEKVGWFRGGSGMVWGWFCAGLPELRFIFYWLIFRLGSEVMFALCNQNKPNVKGKQTDCLILKTFFFFAEILPNKLNIIKRVHSTTTTQEKLDLLKKKKRKKSNSKKFTELLKGNFNKFF